MKDSLPLVALVSTAAIALSACTAAENTSTAITTSPTAATAPTTATTPGSAAPAEASTDGTPVTITAGDVVWRDHLGPKHFR